MSGGLSSNDGSITLSHGGTLKEMLMDAFTFKNAMIKNMVVEDDESITETWQIIIDIAEKINFSTDPTVFFGADREIVEAIDEFFTLMIEQHMGSNDYLS